MIAANRFGHPAESMVMLGVTGTNGKTTTTYLVKHMLEDAGYKVGLIGTNQNLIGDEVIETERTTPESYELHALFARMRDAGCTHVIMEVSSHSLVLDRVHGIPFAVGAFTNLTQDHLISIRPWRSTARQRRCCSPSVRRVLSIWMTLRRRRCSRTQSARA